MEFSEKLKKYRHNLGFTQEQMSVKLNVSRTLITQLETGVIKTNLKFTEKLANFSDKSIAFWLDGEMEKVYSPFDTIDILTDTMIEAGLIKEDGKLDDYCLKMIAVILEKEIKIKLRNKIV